MGRSAAHLLLVQQWSSTLNGAQSAQPDGIAKLCLGRHDGTIAIDTFDKYAGGSVVLDNGKVQCSSCHDVHDQETVVGTHLLRAAQTGASTSGLCLTCHIK